MQNLNIGTTAFHGCKPGVNSGGINNEIGKCLVLIIMRTQKPFQLTAWKFWPLNITSFSKVTLNKNMHFEYYLHMSTFRSSTHRGHIFHFWMLFWKSKNCEIWSQKISFHQNYVGALPLMNNKMLQGIIFTSQFYDSSGSDS